MSQHQQNIRNLGSQEFEAGELLDPLASRPSVRELGILARKGFEITGEELMSQAAELAELPNVNYLGRVKFGKGQINAENVNKSEFLEVLDYAKNNCLLFAADLREFHGACMDGRDDLETEAGQNVSPRPKIIGGPSLFAWYVASIGQFDIIDGSDKPIDQFATVNKRIMDRGIFLGMHHECGAARGILPITENYYNDYENVQQLVGRQARQITELKNGHQYIKAIKEGIGRTHEVAEKAGDNFSEQKMLAVVRQLGGAEAVVHLEVDHDHPTHGHEEDGLVFMRMRNAIIDKNKVNQHTGRKIFYNNSLYAEMIIAALASTPAEYAKGLIIADELPIAGVASLGQNQHVGELTGQYLLAA